MSKKANTKKFNLLKYKRLIMIGVLLVAVIICVTASYITEYNKNKVTVDDVLNLSAIENKEHVEFDEFLENFDSFKIHLEEKLNPNEATSTIGKRVYVITVDFADDADFDNDKFTAKIGLGANWVHYVSDLGSTTVSETNVERTITVSNVEHTFPASGNLWFTNVSKPTVYLYLEWVVDGESFYTYTTVDIQDTIDSSVVYTK